MEGEDRLSTLPDDIKTRILSLLPFQEAIAASVLSRAWRDFWITLPSLDLMQEGLYSNVLAKKLDGVLGKTRISKIRTDTATAFLDEFVYATLTRWSSKLQSDKRTAEFVHLYLPLVSSPNVDKLGVMIEYAIKVQVKDLSIRYGLIVGERRDVDNKTYNLSHKPFLVAPCLRKLCLHGIPLDTQFFEVLVSSCPLIHTLRFEQCHVESLFKVSGLSKLVELRLVNVLGLTKLEITDDLHAPNKLSHLEVKGIVGKLIDVSIDVSACQELKHVAISYAELSESHLDQLPNLQYLYLQGCRIKEAQFHITSKYLESLSLHYCSGLTKVRVHAPSLQDFHCSNNRYYRRLWLDTLEIDAVPQMKYFMCKHVQSIILRTDFPLLETACITMKRTWEVAHLIGFLTSLNHCHDLEIDLEYPDERCLLDTIIRNIPPAICGVKNLKLKLIAYPYDVLQTLRHEELSKYIDALLCISLHPDTISIQLPIHSDTVQGTQYEVKILQFKYKENSGCCGHREWAGEAPAPAAGKSFPHQFDQHLSQINDVPPFYPFKNKTRRPSKVTIPCPPLRGVAEDCFGCKYPPVQCWKRCLQEVLIENQIIRGYNKEPERTVGDDTKVKDFFQNARSTEKIVVKSITPVSVSSAKKKESTKKLWKNIIDDDILYFNLVSTILIRI